MKLILLFLALLLVSCNNMPPRYNRPVIVHKSPIGGGLCYFRYENPNSLNDGDFKDSCKLYNIGDTIYPTHIPK